MALKFEFDEAKSRSNLRKHGIDFITAQELWVDGSLTEVRVRTTDEPRWIVIGRIAGRHWSAVVTYRGDVIRLISVRRSRRKEVAVYESE
jgi:hypothetical protein